MKVTYLISISIITLFLLLSFIVKFEIIYFQVFVIVIGILQFVYWIKNNHDKKIIQSELEQSKNQISLLEKTIDERDQDPFYGHTIRERREAAEMRVRLIEYGRIITRTITSQFSIINLFDIEAEKFLNRFSEFFIINKALAIISGDFIFAFDYNEKTYIFFGDCPGYGIEAGIHKLFVYSSILESLALRKETTSNQIISSFITKIKNLEKNTSSNNINKDILFETKIAICIFDIKSKMLEFSSYKQKMYLLRNQNITEYSGNTLSTENNKESIRTINNISINIENNDCFYLTTDGFPRQIGEKIKKVYSRQRFKEFIIKNENRPLTEQKNLLVKEIEQWHDEQFDDMLIVGIKMF